MITSVVACESHGSCNRSAQTCCTTDTDYDHEHKYNYVKCTCHVQDKHLLEMGAGVSCNSTNRLVKVAITFSGDIMTVKATESQRVSKRLCG